MGGETCAKSENPKEVGMVRGNSAPETLEAIGGRDTSNLSLDSRGRNAPCCTLWRLSARDGAFRRGGLPRWPDKKVQLHTPECPRQSKDWSLLAPCVSLSHSRKKSPAFMSTRHGPRATLALSKPPPSSLCLGLQYAQPGSPLAFPVGSTTGHLGEVIILTQGSPLLCFP